MFNSTYDLSRRAIREAIKHDPVKLAQCEHTWKKYDEWRAKVKTEFEQAAKELFRQYVEQIG